MDLSFSCVKLEYIKVIFKVIFATYICIGRYELDGIDPVEFELICRMIQPKSNDRITIDGVLSSPVFWQKEKILRFLSEVSDRLEREELDAPILNYLEKYRTTICGEGTGL